MRPVSMTFFIGGREGGCGDHLEGILWFIWREACSAMNFDSRRICCCIPGDLVLLPDFFKRRKERKKTNAPVFEGFSGNLGERPYGNPSR